MTDFLFRARGGPDDRPLLLRPDELRRRYTLSYPGRPGPEDDVVPASTVYAIANHLSGPREVVRLPVSHTDRPEEKLWDRFEAYWLRLATRGVPPESGEKREPSLQKVALPEPGPRRQRRRRVRPSTVSSSSILLALPYRWYGHARRSTTAMRVTARGFGTPVSPVSVILG